MQTSLSTEAAANICRHMNDDHADAVAAYARSYGNVADADAAQILALDAHAMQLEVTSGGERRSVRIAFDHVLADSDDARTTLIAMARKAASPAQPPPGS